jgi:hypothetical protein
LLIPEAALLVKHLLTTSFRKKREKSRENYWHKGEKRERKN